MAVAAASALIRARCAAAATTQPAAWQWAQRAGLFSLASLLGPEHEHVLVLDPRLVLTEQGRKQLLSSVQAKNGDATASAGRDLYTAVEVPRGLISQISKGRMELADYDEPGCNWYFGKQAEIFQYSLIGQHPTRSGYTSLIKLSRLEKILKGDASSSLPSFDEFQSLMNDSPNWPTKPFLFAGRMVESADAAVYKLEVQGKLAGLLVSSEAPGSASDAGEGA